MADPVTDSRLPGFNLEVEESKAAAEKAAQEAADAAAEPPRAFRCVMCGGMFVKEEKPCPHCGTSYGMTEAAPDKAKD